MINGGRTRVSDSSRFADQGVEVIIKRISVNCSVFLSERSNELKLRSPIRKHLLLVLFHSPNARLIESKKPLIPKLSLRGGL